MDSNFPSLAQMPAIEEIATRIIRGEFDHRGTQRQIVMRLGGVVQAAKAISQAHQLAREWCRDWQPVAVDDTPVHERAGVRWQARQDRAMANPEFDPYWDTRKCQHCGQVFKLTPGPGNWRKRVFCSDNCRKAASAGRAKSATATVCDGFVSRETPHHR